jgi:hypothetical protein
MPEANEDILYMSDSEIRADRLVMYRELARRLVARQSVSVIANVLDRTPGTVRRYMRDEAFQEILKATDEQVWGEVMQELSSAAQKSIFAKASEDSEDAYSTLTDLMRDSKASGAVRKGCAEKVLEIAGHLEDTTKDKRVAPMSHPQILLFAETVKQVHGSDEPEAELRTSDPAGPPN